MEIAEGDENVTYKDEFTIDDLVFDCGLHKRTIYNILKTAGVKPFKKVNKVNYYDEGALNAIGMFRKPRKRKPAENPTQESIAKSANQNHVLPDQTDPKKDHASVNVPCFATCECAQQIHVLRTELQQCKKIIKLIVAKIQKS